MKTMNTANDLAELITSDMGKERDVMNNTIYVPDNLYQYPVYERDSGLFVGKFTRKEIEEIGFRSDYYTIYFN